MKILLIQKDTDYLHFLYHILTQHNHSVEVATEGRLGFSIALHARFDLIVIDTQLSAINGIEVVRRLREENDSTPILLLSDKTDATSKAEGLYAGADDYLVKPIESDELLARIFALHRRRTGGFNGPTILRIDNLELNIAEKVAYRANQRIKLTAREFQLLEFLLKNAGRVVTKTQILEKVWEISGGSSTNKVEVYINFLRNKIDREFEHKLIHTHMGIGYLITSGLQ